MTIFTYIITPIIATAVILGFVLSYKRRRRSRDKHSVVSWYNHLTEQYLSIYDNVAEQYFEKIELAERYNDQDCIIKLHKLYDDTIRTSNNIEGKLNSLKIYITDKKFSRVSYDELLNDYKIVEDYIAELVDKVTFIRSIHPVNSSNDSRYEYERSISCAVPESKKPWKNSRFFASCNSKEDLVKKYRELAKIYHPDNVSTGDAESFKSLKAEYNVY